MTGLPLIMQHAVPTFIESVAGFAIATVLITFGFTFIFLARRTTDVTQRAAKTRFALTHRPSFL